MQSYYDGCINGGDTVNDYGDNEDDVRQQSKSNNNSPRRHVPNKLRGVTTNMTAGSGGGGSSSPSSSSSSSSSPSKTRLKGRKARPWLADAASWKQQMRERKAVFHNFAVEEDGENEAAATEAGAGEEKQQQQQQQQQQHEAEQVGHEKDLQGGFDQNHHHHDDNDDEKKDDNQYHQLLQHHQDQHHHHDDDNKTTTTSSLTTTTTTTTTRITDPGTDTSPNGINESMISRLEKHIRQHNHRQHHNDVVGQSGSTAEHPDHLAQSRPSSLKSDHQHEQQQYRRTYDNVLPSSNGNVDDDEVSVGMIGTTTPSTMLTTSRTSAAAAAAAGTTYSNDVVVVDDDVERARRREEEVEQYIRKMKQKEEEMMKASATSSVITSALNHHRVRVPAVFDSTSDLLGRRQRQDEVEQHGFVTPTNKNGQKSGVHEEVVDDEIMAARSPMRHPSTPEEEGDIPMMTQSKQIQHPYPPSMSTEPTGSSMTQTIDGATMSSLSQPLPSKNMEIVLPQDSPLNGGDLFMSALFGTIPKFHNTKAPVDNNIESESSSSVHDDDKKTRGVLRLDDSQAEFQRTGLVSTSLSDDDQHRAASSCCCPLDSMSKDADEKNVKSDASTWTTSSERPTLTIDTGVVEQLDSSFCEKSGEAIGPLDTPHPIPSAVQLTSDQIQNPEEAVDPDPLQRARKGFMISDLNKSLQTRPKTETVIESESPRVVVDLKINDMEDTNTTSDPVHHPSVCKDHSIAEVTGQFASIKPITTTITADHEEVDDYDENGVKHEMAEPSKIQNDHVNDFDDIDDYDGGGVKGAPEQRQLSENESPSDDQTSQANDDPSQTAADVLSNDAEIQESQPKQVDNSITLQKNLIIEDLTARLQTLHTSHHKCIEAQGRAGPNGPVKPPPKQLTPSEQKTFESRGNVFHELNTRVSSIFTEHHHVVESPTAKLETTVVDSSVKTSCNGDIKQPAEVSDEPTVAVDPPSSFVEIGGQSWEEYIEPDKVDEGKSSELSESTKVEAEIPSQSIADSSASSITDNHRSNDGEAGAVGSEDAGNDNTVSKPSKRRESVKGKKWKERLASKKAVKVEYSSKAVESVPKEDLPPSSLSPAVPEVSSHEEDLPPSSLTPAVPEVCSHDHPSPMTATLQAKSHSSENDQQASGQSPVGAAAGKKDSAGKSSKWKARLAKLRGSEVTPMPAMTASEEKVVSHNVDASKKNIPESMDKVLAESEEKDRTDCAPKNEQNSEKIDTLSTKLDDTQAVPAAAGLPTSQNRNEKTNNSSVQIALRTSFNKFDQFLSSRPGFAVDEESVYTEVTIGQEFLAVNTSSPNDLGRQPSNDEDEQSYMEFTVDESVQASYMEETVYSEYTMGPTTKYNATKPTGDQKISPFMSNLLSSRMFQDVGTSIPVQHDTSFDYHDKRFPTINVHSAHDDDDMTQITMDHGLHDMEEDNNNDDEGRPVLMQNNQLVTSVESGRQCLITPTHTALPPPAPTRDHKVTGAGRPPFEKSPSVLSAKSSKSLKSSKSRHSNKSRKSVGESSTTSQLSSESSKQRMAEILRKEIWSRDLDVVRGALDELSKDAVKGYKYRSHIVRLGGIMGVIRTMEMNAGDEAVQSSCSRILGTLALEPENQALVCEMEGIPLIVRAMQDFPAAVGLQEASCSALATICRRQEMESTVDIMKGADGAVLTLLISMTKNPDNRLIRAKAFGAISSLCIDNKDRLSELADAGGIMTLTMALQKPWDDMNEQHEAISSLSILLRGVAELNAGLTNAPSAAPGKTSGSMMTDNDGSNSSLETQEDEHGSGDEDGFSSNSYEQVKPKNIVAVDSDLDYDSAELESLPRIGSICETPKNEVGTIRTSSDVSGSMSSEQNVNETNKETFRDDLERNQSDGSELEEMLNKASEHQGMEPLDVKPLVSSDETGTDPLRTSGGSWTPTQFVRLKHSQMSSDDVVNEDESDKEPAGRNEGNADNTTEKNDVTGSGAKNGEECGEKVAGEEDEKCSIQ